MPLSRMKWDFLRKMAALRTRLTLIRTVKPDCGHGVLSRHADQLYVWQTQEAPTHRR